MRDLGYVTGVFLENHLLWNLCINSWLSKRGIFQNIKAYNFVRSITVQYASVDLEFTGKKVTDKDNISTLMILERCFDFGSFLNLGI